MAITIHETRCPANHPCPSVRICPHGALKQNGFDAPVVDETLCTDCGACVSFCPMGALRD